MTTLDKKPRLIKSIWYDPNYYDGYTIVFKDGSILGLSENPSHPLGFSQFSTGEEGSHLGKQIKWQDLTIELRQHIRSRI